MQPVITAAIITATVAITTAAVTSVTSQRQQYHDRRNEYLHERCKDAYIRLIDAARDFLPLTEPAVRHLVHQRTQSTLVHDPDKGCPPPDEQGIIWCSHFHESDFLDSPGAQLSDAWYQQAPGKLTELTAAWDRVHMEGPEDLHELAREINELAHWLFNNEELISLELDGQDPSDGLGPTQDQLLTSRINAYMTKSACFRRAAREKLDALTPQPAPLTLLLRSRRRRTLP